MDYTSNKLDKSTEQLEHNVNYVIPTSLQNKSRSTKYEQGL